MDIVDRQAKLLFLDSVMYEYVVRSHPHILIFHINGIEEFLTKLRIYLSMYQLGIETDRTLHCKGYYPI